MGLVLVRVQEHISLPKESEILGVSQTPIVVSSYSATSEASQRSMVLAGSSSREESRQE